MRVLLATMESEAKGFMECVLRELTKEAIWLVQELLGSKNEKNIRKIRY